MAAISRVGRVGVRLAGVRPGSLGATGGGGRRWGAAGGRGWAEGVVWAERSAAPALYLRRWRARARRRRSRGSGPYLQTRLQYGPPGSLHCFWYMSPGSWSCLYGACAGVAARTGGAARGSGPYISKSTGRRGSSVLKPGVRDVYIGRWGCRGRPRAWGAEEDWVVAVINGQLPGRAPLAWPAAGAGLAGPATSPSESLAAPYCQYYGRFGDPCYRYCR